jgi:hypothetical protein
VTEYELRLSNSDARSTPRRDDKNKTLFLSSNPDSAFLVHVKETLVRRVSIASGSVQSIKNRIPSHHIATFKVGMERPARTMARSASIRAQLSFE